jgi:hypothetical protein
MGLIEDFWALGKGEGDEAEALARFEKARDRRGKCDRCRTLPAAVRLDTQQIMAGRPTGYVRWICRECSNYISDYIIEPKMCEIAERNEVTQAEMAERKVALRAQMDEARARFGWPPRPEAGAAGPKKRAGRRKPCP